MSTFQGNRQPLRLRTVQSVAAQDRIAARVYGTTKNGLFLKEDKPSCLKIVQRAEALNVYFHGKNQKSRSNTISTLVNREENLEYRIGKVPAGPMNPPNCPKQTQSSTVVESVGQLDSALSSLSSFTAFCIPQQHSFARLSVTQHLYNRLCTCLEVFDAFRDTIMYMGLREQELEVAPPRLRWQSLNEEENVDDETGWECSYCLRYIEENHRPGERPWSLRQFAVYNKTELVADRASWIFVSIPNDVQVDFQDMAGKDDCTTLEKSVGLHAGIMATAMAFWRPYIVYLTVKVKQHNDEIKFADPMCEGSVDLAANGTRLKLKNLDDDIVDAIVALEANQDTMNFLLSMWRCCNIAVGSITDELSIMNILTERSQDVDAFLRTLRMLREKLSTCTQIVSSFSELANGKSLQANGDSLKTLAQQARLENEQTLKLTVQAGQDTAAVKTLTVIALIFLPTTVVLSFFSTSLIDVSRGDFILASKWWLFLAIAGPLTILTLLIWHIWVHWRK